MRARPGFALLLLALSAGCASVKVPPVTATAPTAATLPTGYWSAARAAELLSKSETIRLDPDRSSLTPSEREALVDLFEVGAIMQRLYERERHPEALASFAELTALHATSGKPANTQALLDLYQLAQGPIALTLDNRREPFLPVAAASPARNVYPVDLTAEQLDREVAADPAQSARLLDARSVVRRATAGNLNADIETLQQFSLVRELHPGELERLQRMIPRPDGLYSVDYAIAYAPEMTQAFRALMRAAAKLSPDDTEFARYLRHRARDLVSNDYESGDAAWVTGKFKHLNAQIGAYETYDDGLRGIKAFHGMSILVRDEVATTELQQALRGLQGLEDALPYRPHKQVRDDIPVGVYGIVADFGQARSANTASILPNDPGHVERYGRTILLRENIIRNPTLFAADERVWRAATEAGHATELAVEGHFQRTLWHEIGHYLGPARDPQGRPLSEVLGNYADALEELKADLVAEFLLRRMRHPALRAIEASGIHRTLQSVEPRSDQPYESMQLIQFNWFIAQGLLRPDVQTARLTIDYARYEVAVESLLAEVLRLQAAGDKTAVAAFFGQWSSWNENVHGQLAARLREAQGPRYRIFRYGALGD